MSAKQLTQYSSSTTFLSDSEAGARRADRQSTLGARHYVPVQAASADGLTTFSDRCVLNRRRHRRTARSSASHKIQLPGLVFHPGARPRPDARRAAIAVSFKSLVCIASGCFARLSKLLHIRAEETGTVLCDPAAVAYAHTEGY